jgi:hypothetical protein
MLKLLAMSSTGNALLALSLLFFNLLRPAADGSVFLLYPGEGDYLQGVVSISGGMDVQGFLSYEAAFAYESSADEPQSWFTIQREVNQVQKGVLAVWDTTTITDGDYKLRVTVQLEGGGQVETIVRNLHVSNYSPIPGGVIAPTLPAAPKVGEPPRNEAPAPVELPSNPLELSDEKLSTSMYRGLIGALILLAGLGVYTGVHRLLRKY